jgi:hypothetical protein
MKTETKCNILTLHRRNDNLVHIEKLCNKHSLSNAATNTILTIHLVLYYCHGVTSYPKKKFVGDRPLRQNNFLALKNVFENFITSTLKTPEVLLLLWLWFWLSLFALLSKAEHATLLLTLNIGIIS